MFILLKVGISRRCYSGSGIERFHISSPAVSLISSSAFDTLETPCGDHTHLRLISLERNLLYLQLEIVSSQWRAPLLMLLPKHQPPPQQACFYHRDQIQACPQTAVSAISECAGELSEVGRLSQKLLTTLPVISWTCYSSREEQQWMKMTEQHDFWGIVKAAMPTADGVRLSCPTHTCHTPPSSDVRMCIIPYFPHQKQQCHHDTVSSDREVIISSTRWTCVPQHTEKCSDAVMQWDCIVEACHQGLDLKVSRYIHCPKEDYKRVCTDLAGHEGKVQQLNVWIPDTISGKRAYSIPDSSFTLRKQCWDAGEAGEQHEQQFSQEITLWRLKPTF